MMRTTRARRGWTLLQMLIVISVTSIMLGGATTMIAVSLRASRTLSDSLAEHRSLAQLDLRLRSDVRRAASARTDSQALTLEHDGGEVTFAMVQGGIERTATNAAGERLARELYRVHSPLVAVWEVSDDPQPIVTLRFDGPPDAKSDSPRPAESWRALRTIAVVGRGRAAGLGEEEQR